MVADGKQPNGGDLKRKLQPEDHHPPGTTPEAVHVMARNGQRDGADLKGKKKDEAVIDEDDEAAVQAEAAEMSRLSTMERLRFLTKRYGKVAIGFYFFLGTADLVLTYAAIRAGVDVQPILDSIFSAVGLDFHHYFSPNMGAFVAAYSFHKVGVCMRGRWKDVEGMMEVEMKKNSCGSCHPSYC